MFLETELKFVAEGAVGPTFPNVLFLSIILFVSVVQSRELRSGLQQLDEQKVSPLEGFYSYLLVSELEFSTLSIRIVVLSEVVEVISSFSLAHLT